MERENFFMFHFKVISGMTMNSFAGAIKVPLRVWPKEYPANRVVVNIKLDLNGFSWRVKSLNNTSVCKYPFSKY